MKTLIALSGLCLALCAQGQTYNAYTNLMAGTNWFAATNTFTYTGTNYLDMTRNSEFGCVFIGRGSSNSTNTITKTFQVSHDRTNWFAPAFAFVATVNGTNVSVAGSNFTVGAFGYVREYQTVTATTNSVTNASFIAVLKGYRRD